MGAFTFSISGALTAIKMRFDGFGIAIVAFVTAIGGGTIRDLILNKQVFWMEDISFVYAILLGTIIAIIFRKKQKHIYRPLMLFDAIGLGLFTIIGVQIGISQGLEMVNCVLIGTMTGTFGGVIRDILVNQIPVIFRKEIYATISLVGGAIYYALSLTELPYLWVKLIPILLIISFRFIVLKLNWSLPSIYSKEE